MSEEEFHFETSKLSCRLDTGFTEYLYRGKLISSPITFQEDMSPFLKSPMPGTVVSVAVSVGDDVSHVNLNS